MATIESIPPEILIEIALLASITPASVNKEAERKASLRNFSLVCKKWQYPGHSGLASHFWFFGGRDDQRKIDLFKNSRTIQALRGWNLKTKTVVLAKCTSTMAGKMIGMLSGVQRLTFSLINKLDVTVLEAGTLAGEKALTRPPSLKLIHFLVLRTKLPQLLQNDVRDFPHESSSRVQIQTSAHQSSSRPNLPLDDALRPSSPLPPFLQLLVKQHPVRDYNVLMPRHRQFLPNPH